MPRWIQVLVFVLIIGLILLFAFGLRARGEPPRSSGAAPDFAITSFEGQTIKLSELRGKVVVINFWASWCAPCRDEAPFLEKTWRQYKDRGVVFIGVDYIDSETAAKAYLKEFGITYFNGPDIGSEIYQRYRAKGVPETYFVGKDGNLAGNALGPIARDSMFMTERAFVQKLEELLAK
ncbi:MAG: TlpA family protein disulfide reductase [Anaerolineales bacterium]|nr:TlpA family protein disulfide reductase [Anaerolineales bacterium]